MKSLLPSTQALLQAILGPEDRQVPAIQQWQAITALERLEPGQFQLLPLIHQQVEALASDHPWLPRIKGIYRRTRFANQLALKAAAEALQILERAGLPALLIGPAALALTVYTDQRPRLIGVPQVLVPIAERLAAMRALCAAGWQAAPQSGDLAAPRLARWQAGQRLHRPLSAKDGLVVYLCWHALPLAPVPAWSTQWFARSVPLGSPFIQARTLAPTDQLFQALAAEPALEWIALVDGQRILSRDAIDWAQLVFMAEASQLALMLAERLAMMQALGVQVPGQHLAQLRRARVPGYAATAWRLDQIAPWERTAWQRLRLGYAGFRQCAAAQGLAPHPGNFYAYVRTRLASDSLCATLKQGLRRITTPIPLPHGY